MSYQADDLPTHAGVLKDVVGVNAKDQGLPGNEGLANIERPTEIVAEADKKSIRKDERKKDSILSKVTSLARGEQYLVQGADLKKFFDAGHLIGDQLIGGTTDSFVYHNLAPQVSEFNTPKYSATENEIRGYANKGFKVRMQVNLTYPGAYGLTVSQLKYRKAIPDKVKLPDSTVVQFARRIPTGWHLHAMVVNSAEPAPVAENIGTPGAAMLGAPFSMVVSTYTTAVADPTKVHLVYNRLTQKLLASQWAPNEAISADDVMSYLIRTYPDILDQDDLVRLMKGEPKERVKVFKQATFEILNTMMDLGEKLAALPDAPQAQVLLSGASPRIRAKVAQATDVEITLAEAASGLVTAKAWLEDLMEEIDELRKVQEQTLPFGGFTLNTQLQKWDMSGVWDFQQSQQQMEEDYVPTSESESQEIEIRSGFSNFTDLTTNTMVTDVAQFDDGRRGSLRWSTFGVDCPVKYEEKLLINLGGQPTIVVVMNAERPQQSAAWIIAWRHPG